MAGVISLSERVPPCLADPVLVFAARGCARLPVGLYSTSEASFFSGVSYASASERPSGAPSCIPASCSPSTATERERVEHHARLRAVQ